MRIESMDASSITSVSTQSLGPVNKTGTGETNDDSLSANITKDNISISEPISIKIENNNFSQLKDFEKKYLPISEKVLIDAIQKANKAISVADRAFEYSIHEKTKQIMIKVVDTDTHEVVREIPPEKVLDMLARMWKMAGIIVDERR